MGLLEKENIKVKSILKVKTINGNFQEKEIKDLFDLSKDFIQETITVSQNDHLSVQVEIQKQKFGVCKNVWECHKCI